MKLHPSLVSLAEQNKTGRPQAEKTMKSNTLGFAIIGFTLFLFSLFTSINAFAQTNKCETFSHNIYCEEIGVSESCSPQFTHLDGNAVGILSNDGKDEIAVSFSFNIENNPDLETLRVQVDKKDVKFSISDFDKSGTIKHIEVPERNFSNEQHSIRLFVNSQTPIKCTHRENIYFVNEGKPWAQMGYSTDDSGSGNNEISEIIYNPECEEGDKLCEILIDNNPNDKIVDSNKFPDGIPNVSPADPSDTTYEYDKVSRLPIGCFSDTIGSQYEYGICELKNRGIVVGYSPDQFSPSQGITRAEALKISMLAFGHQQMITKQAPFKDVSENAWYYPYIAGAKNSGLTSSFSNSSVFFNPNDIISIDQAEEMVTHLSGIHVPKDVFSGQKEISRGAFSQLVADYMQ